MKVICEINVAKPQQLVFNVFSDIKNAATNVDGIESIEFLGDITSGVGTKWRETRKMFGKEATEDMWVSQLNAPASYEVLAESRGTKYKSTYTFEELGPNATKVVMTFEGQPVSLGAKLLSPLGILFSGTMKKMLAKDMANLKDVCEKQ
jgi:hypothetical protein